MLLDSLILYFFKPETLGKEFNNVACYVTGLLMLLAIHIGKEGMKDKKYH